MLSTISFWKINPLSQNASIILKNVLTKELLELAVSKTKQHKE